MVNNSTIVSLFGRWVGPEKGQFGRLTRSYVSRFLLVPLPADVLGREKKLMRFTAVYSSCSLISATSFDATSSRVACRFSSITWAWCVYSSMVSLTNASDTFEDSRSQFSKNAGWNVMPRCGCGGFVVILKYVGGLLFLIDWLKTDSCVVMWLLAAVSLLKGSARSFTSLKSVSESLVRTSQSHNSPNVRELPAYLPSHEPPPRVEPWEVYIEFILSICQNL